MAKRNLVVVESAAKAKTIEKFLGRDYVVRASFGHVRDLPDEQARRRHRARLRADVRRPPEKKEVVKQAQGRGEGRRGRLPGDRPRPRGRGDRLAPRGRDGPEATSRSTGSSSTRSPRTRSWTRSSTRARSTSSASTPSRPGGSSTGWSATRSARCSGRRSGAASRPGASSRSPCGWSSTASARSRPSCRSSTGRSRPTCASRCPARRVFRAALTEQDGKKIDRFDLKTGEQAQAIVDELQGAGWVVREVKQTRADRATRPRRSPPARSSRRPAASSASPPGGRWRSPSSSTRASVDGGESVGLITYMRTDSVTVAETAIAEVRETIAQRYGARVRAGRAARLPHPQPAAQEAHEAIRPTSAERAPESVRPFLERPARTSATAATCSASTT